LEWTPNRIVAHLDPSPTSPVQLVFSEIAYPGWQAWIDGQPARLETAGGILRAVSLQPDARTVVLRFRPLSVILGLWLGLLGIGLMLWQGLAGSKHTASHTREQGEAA